MKRIAFTIIYNGLHHLKRLQFAERMAVMFDHWVIVEGHSLPNGSTRHCNDINASPVSEDGTIEFLTDFAATHGNVHFYSRGSYFDSKDTQVNACISIIRKLSRSCYLWEVDVDEHWSEEDIIKAEQFASNSTHIGFKFQFNHFVGDGIVAVGDWGSGYLNRLWKWSGQFFRSHEPAMLNGQMGVQEVPEIKFDHYSYTDPVDVLFKSKYYRGHQHVYENWDKIQPPNNYPIPISELFGKDTPIGKSNSQIIKLCNKNKEAAQLAAADQQFPARYLVRKNPVSGQVSQDCHALAN